MNRLLWLLFPFLALLRGAEPAPGFLGSLSPEERARLGLAGLTPTQAAGLEAAVEAYAGRRGLPATEAERSGSETGKPAGGTSLPPRVAAPAVASGAEGRQKEETPGMFRARIAGQFRGWSGGTYFPLTNGQVWRQVGTEALELPPREEAEVEIFPSRSGYWRLRFDGAWITVRRLQ